MCHRKTESKKSISNSASKIAVVQGMPGKPANALPMARGRLWQPTPEPATQQTQRQRSSTPIDARATRRSLNQQPDSLRNQSVPEPGHIPGHFAAPLLTILRPHSWTFFGPIPGHFAVPFLYFFGPIPGHFSDPFLDIFRPHSWKKMHQT